MFSRLWSALGRVADAAGALADNLFSLAETVRQANSHIRERLSLDALPGTVESPALVEAQPAETVPEPAKRRK